MPIAPEVAGSPPLLFLSEVHVNERQPYIPSHPLPSLARLMTGFVALLGCVVSRADEGASAGGPIAAQVSLDDSLSARWTESIEPLMRTHCGDCHFAGNHEGGVAFDEYNALDKIRAHASTWEQIRGLLRADAMPPPESSTMGTADRRAVIDWIESALHEVDCNCKQDLPHVTLRRLNQLEYDNTIQDLFQIDLKPSKQVGFISDDVGNGFDNQGEVLSLPPITLEKYLQAASLVANHVVQTDREKFRRQRFEGESLFPDQRLEAPMYIAGGSYSLSVRMRFGDGQQDTCKAKLLLDETELLTWDVAPKDETYKVDFVVTPGEHQLAVLFAEDSHATDRGTPNRRLNIESLRIVGPADGTPCFPRSHESVVISYPEQKDAPERNSIGFSEAARRVFSKLLVRAYRRPVTEEEIESIVLLCRKASDAGFNYEESLRFGIQGTLVSPSFLFRSESMVRDHGIDRIDDYGLANRLSYFLWSTMPDAELFQLAGQGRLHEPSVLSEQVDRMIASPKIESFVKGFFAQWLGLRNLNRLELDRDKYPIWSDPLRAALIKETELFCQAMLRTGTVDDITNAHHTFANPRLAEFYGVPYNGRDPAEMYRRRPGKRNDQRRTGLYEHEQDWIRVELPPNRQGLLTQGAVLSLTSNPTRTSPVKRGKWILENLLGDPPPSAPPNVPSLEQAHQEGNVSLRERLEIHRSNPSCAGCHKLMDPIGLGLENFDAIGKWRDTESNLPIQAQGTLADGRPFQGPSELVRLLSERKPQMVRNISARMLTYALGRGLQRQDRCDIDRIVDATHQHGDAIAAIVQAIVQSDAFQQRAAIESPQSVPVPDPSADEAH